MSVSASSQNPDLDTAMAGGSTFTSRMEDLGRAKASLDEAYQALGLGKDAKAAYDEATALRDKAKETLEKAKAAAKEAQDKAKDKAETIVAEAQDKAANLLAEAAADREAAKQALADAKAATADAGKAQKEAEAEAKRREAIARKREAEAEKSWEEAKAKINQSDAAREGAEARIAKLEDFLKAMKGPSE